MLRWGVLGTGRVADGAVVPAMRAAGHDIAVVGSRSLGRAQAFAANHGVRRARGSYGEVLEADDVDAVYVATSNDAHEAWTLEALAAGKHVLCEKPMTTTEESAQRMAAAAAGAERVLMEALMTRFHPRTTALLESVWAGDIGELRLITSSLSFLLDDDEDIRASASSGGGALLDMGVYPVSMIRWLAAQEPESVRALVRPWRTGVDGTVAAALAFGSDVTASFTVSFGAAQHELLEVVGTEGTMRLPKPFTAGASDEATLEVDGQALGSWQADPYLEMVKTFEGALNGADPGLSPDDSAATAAVLDAVRAAAGRSA